MSSKRRGVSVINKLEERKKKKAKAYKFKVFMGMVLLSLIVTGILMYSKVDTKMSYPLEHYTIGEASRDIFTEDSGLMLTDIIYEEVEVEVKGNSKELQSIDDVLVEVDLFKVRDYINAQESAVELDENGEPIEEELDENGEPKETEETEGEEVTETDEVQEEVQEEESLTEEGEEESLDTEGIEGVESAEDFVVSDLENFGGNIELTEDGYLILELPIVVMGYDKVIKPLEISQDTIQVSLRVDKVVEKDGEEEGEDESDSAVEEGGSDTEGVTEGTEEEDSESKE